MEGGRKEGGGEDGRGLCVAAAERHTPSCALIPGSQSRPSTSQFHFQRRRVSLRGEREEEGGRERKKEKKQSLKRRLITRLL